MELYRVHQQLVSAPLEDPAMAVARQLDALALEVPRGEIAIPVGSRGIDQIDTVIRAAGDWLKTRGARPFIVPAMGSHSGATATGQRALIESLGISEHTMEMPIRASMDVVKLGSVASGDVWMDRYAYESDGVLVINRIKLHTSFSGPIQSGLIKMLVVGLGKIQSARTFHNTPSPAMSELLQEMGAMVLDSGRVLGGLGLVEDGFDRLAEIHALPATEILTREPILLDRARSYFPRLPVDNLNMLVVDEMGKIYSGTGLDTNVIGYRGLKRHEDLLAPVIRHIAVLNLSVRSQGNAFGVGLADFITRRLRDAIDEEKTLINVLTTGEMSRMKIPATTFLNDEDLVNRIVERFGTERWLWIPDTLHLGTLYASADLKPELEDHPSCTVDPEPVPLRFIEGRHQLSFSTPESP